MTMTLDRFRTLAEAYGGAVARWPSAERDAAAVLMASDPEGARLVLEQADSLDRLLDSWRPAPASHEVMARIIAAAPAAGVRARLSWLWRAGVGVGLSAACAAGLAVGFIFTPVSVGDSLETVTASISDYEALSAAVGDEV